MRPLDTSRTPGAVDSPPENSVDELAIFGGMPAFDTVLHVGRPNLGDRDDFLHRINDILDRKWFTNHGPYVREFEKRIKALLGVKHCIATCNATTGLQIAIRALELSGEVIVPAFTFVATPHALQWQGITPVFCDINPETYTIDTAQVESLVTPRTTGILGVHLWGRPCDVQGLAAIAERHRLKLLFDAAHAFACSHEGKMIGNFGDAEVFSFHATKFLNSFEGGAVVTNNDKLAQTIRLMTNFGFYGLDNVIAIGTNGKMSEVSGAMGITSIESIEEFIAANRRNYETYLDQFGSITGLRAVRYQDTERSNFQYIVFEVDESRTGITRDQLVTILIAENVIARRYFFPGCHRMQPYCSSSPDGGWTLPVTEGLANRVLCFPSGTAVGDFEIKQIAELVRFCVDRSEEIKLRMGSDEKFAGAPLMLELE
jgi:dTDP-4-amino-4,6-dideoxygalactose transaminase